MKCASAAAEHYWDRVYEQECEDDELDAYLEENGITYEQHLAEIRQAEEDAAADAYFYREMA